ncbi:MAG: cytidylate kinase-like family protein [Deltaproteobacteria bacterium]|nr:cytidylate kinase-like family protein [Deltaproteobacteria bacterium]
MKTKTRSVIKIIATELGKKLGLDVFHQEIINEMAESAQVSSRILETLDEKGLSVLDEWITSLVDKKHLWPDQYLRHLMKVIGTIGKHGSAVIVGRGANFVLPSEGRIRVRIVAPLDVRVENVSSNFGVSAEDAKRRIIRTESERRAFIRKYFNADITDPINYDLVLNTGTLSIEAAANSIKSASKS